MVKIRQEKVDKIAFNVPEQQLDNGPEKGDVLVLGWGSTYGVIKTVVQELLEEGHKVSHAHLRYIRPFPRNLGDILKKYCVMLT